MKAGVQVYIDSIGYDEFEQKYFVNMAIAHHKPMPILQHCEDFPIWFPRITW
ncbi:MAG: hypothetical protein IPI30_03545 [Saprospiraceae bacterium]|nr:hypothetical protein [Candidatus Vicinibacter affinis]